MPFEEAVEKAVDYCIKNGILSDFLSKNRAEAIAVSIFEYDAEKHMRSEREAGIEQGIQALVAVSREYGGTKQETVEHLVTKLGITLERAAKGVEKYWEQDGL